MQVCVDATQHEHGHKQRSDGQEVNSHRRQIVVVVGPCRRCMVCSRCIEIAGGVIVLLRADCSRRSIDGVPDNGRCIVAAAVGILYNNVDVHRSWLRQQGSPVTDVDVDDSHWRWTSDQTLNTGADRDV